MGRIPQDGSFAQGAPPARLERFGEVAVLTLDNPPVNALSHGVRLELMARLDEIEADASIRAVVLTGAGGRMFCAGADVRELGAPPRAPPMADVLARLDRLDRLTLAALNGQALGGGLETALVCDHRLAVASARLALPEIKLGLIPGGGGTQRLPRLIGVDAALELMLSGRTLDATQARALGLVDAIIDEGGVDEGGVDDGIVPAAVAFARSRLDAADRPTRLSRRRLEAPGFDFAARRAAALAQAKGLAAAGALVEAVEAAVTARDFDAGLERERALFAACRQSPSSAALRHLFNAERVVAEVPGASSGDRPREVRRVSVVGAGTMGTGVALALADAGLEVVLLDQTQAALERAQASIVATYAAQAGKGRITAAEAQARGGRVTYATDLEAGVASADLVIECVFEDMALKCDLFARLGPAARPGAVLATNTSALDVDRIAAASGRAADGVGMHFFSPANVMRLVEVVRAAQTAPEVLATAMAVCKRMGKIGVVAGVCDGFIGNRMLRGYRREAEFLVLEGAPAEAVDAALTGFGMAMGPHAMGDMAGLDISAAGRHRLRAEGKLPHDPRLGAVQDELVARGRLGLKSGAGMFRYDAGSRTPRPDPEVAELVVAQAHRLGVTRREIAPSEVISRCLLQLVNEGARILEEGVALGSADIDVVYCNGYGFPRHHGGPMFYADTLGLDHVLEAMTALRASHGSDYWTPAPLLERLAAEGLRFSDLPRGGRN